MNKELASKKMSKLAFKELYTKTIDNILRGFKLGPPLKHSFSYIFRHAIFNCTAAIRIHSMNKSFEENCIKLDRKLQFVFRTDWMVSDIAINL